MINCLGCAKEIHETAISCPQCGCVQQPVATVPSIQAKPAKESSGTALNKKFHLMLVIAATVAVLLLYTTQAIPLIGVATGISFGLSWRLFMFHKNSNFAGTKKLDWMLLAGISTAAFILMFAELYNIQAPLLIFVALRSLMMYFKMNSNETEVAK